MTSASVSPAVIRLHSQGLPGAGDVLLQRGAADHATAAALLEVGASVRHALAQVDLVELQDPCERGERRAGP